ncbi:barstar family protein [uncultured Mycobacterium sp.]|uniref:barstar family protein n=1 Tax=uncultured Mycobacterium sp. TaxID=171292 RepID=UPI0035CC6C26
MAPRAGVELRTIDGAHTKTLDALYDAFAEPRHFPPWVGPNSRAFDDFMRDLDNMVNIATEGPPAPYLTDITDAHLILADQQEAFSWFASYMPFYRDYYRVEATPLAAFGLLLFRTPDQVHEVRARWLAVGITVATVKV